jgi:hypothetical protein
MLDDGVMKHFANRWPSMESCAAGDQLAQYRAPTTCYFDRIHGKGSRLASSTRDAKIVITYVCMQWSGGHIPQQSDEGGKFENFTWHGEW